MIFDAVDERLRREHNERAWLVYHVEALRRSKRVPRLDRMLIKRKSRTRGQQSWQQQMHVMSTWAARVDRAIAVKNSLGA
jgi:hypothetical protein